MTLREIGDWLSSAFNQFMSDLEIVGSEPLWDWPLYIVVLGVPAILAGAYLFGMLIALPMILWQELWSKHFDADGNPITQVGRVAARIWEAFFLAVILVAVWMFVLGLMFAAAPEFARQADGVWQIVIFGVPTLAVVLLYLARKRGRRLNAEEQNSKKQQKQE